MSYPNRRVKISRRGRIGAVQSASSDLIAVIWYLTWLSGPERAYKYGENSVVLHRFYNNDKDDDNKERRDIEIYNWRRRSSMKVLIHRR